MNLSDQEHDDLTIIKGIGPARLRWFIESLGVRTFQDLAELSVEDIESRLKADNQIASRKSIKDWIAEAYDLAAMAKPAAKQTSASENMKAERQLNDTVEKNTSTSEPVESADGDDNGEPSSTIRENGWKPFASFVVEFQERPADDKTIEYRTTAHHVEADTNKEWPGIERDQQCHWMLDQIGDRIAEEPVFEAHPDQEAIAEQVPMATTPVEVRIAEVHAYQPPQADAPVGSGKAGQSFEGHLAGDQPFALEILFDLVGEAATDLAAEQPVYIVRSYVQDQISGESRHLDDAEPARLVKGELRYAAKLPAVTLPRGEYRLFAFVNIQAASVRPDFVTFPMVNVKR